MKYERSITKDNYDNQEWETVKPFDRGNKAYDESKETDMYNTHTMPHVNEKNINSMQVDGCTCRPTEGRRQRGLVQQEVIEEGQGGTEVPMETSEEVGKCECVKINRVRRY